MATKDRQLREVPPVVAKLEEIEEILEAELEEEKADEVKLKVKYHLGIARSLKESIRKLYRAA